MEQETMFGDILTTKMEGRLASKTIEMMNHSMDLNPTKSLGSKSLFLSECSHARKTSRMQMWLARARAE